MAADNLSEGGSGPYDSQASKPLGTAVFTIILSALVVSLRVWARRGVGRSLWIDDYFAVASFFAVLGTGVAIGCMTQFGLGRHAQTLSEDELRLYLRTYFVSLVLYSIALIAIKMTFLFQYLKVLDDGWRAHRKFIACMVLIGLWAMSEFWVSVLACSPLAAFWDVTVPGSCIPDSPSRYIFIASDIMSAVAIFFLPALFMRRVVIGWPEAIVLSVVYTLGLFVVVLQLVRIRYVNLGRDFTWANADRTSLIMAELSVALACACVVLLHPLAQSLLPRWFHTFRFEDADEKRVDSPWSRDEPSRQEAAVMVNPDASTSSLAFGRTGGVRPIQKNQNHTPRDARRLAEVGLRDDSGDLSDEILGLHATRRAMQRDSFMRSLSETDVRRAAARQKQQPNRTGEKPLARTRTSPSSQPPSAGYRRSVIVAEAPPTAVVKPPPAMVHAQRVRPALVTVPPRRYSSDGGEERRLSLQEQEQQRRERRDQDWRDQESKRQQRWQDHSRESARYENDGYEHPRRSPLATPTSQSRPPSYHLAAYSEQLSHGNWPPQLHTARGYVRSDDHRHFDAPKRKPPDLEEGW